MSYCQPKIIPPSSVDSHYKDFLIAAALFVGGGCAYYLYLRYYPHPTQAQKEAECVFRQIHEVKHEITNIKQSLTDAVFDVRRELDGIKTVVSKKYGLQSAKSHQSCTLSDDDDDDEFLSVENFPLSVSDTALIGLDAVLNRVDDLHERSDEDKERAMKILQDQEIIFPSSYEILWRLARAHIALYELRDDYDVRNVHATAALDYAKQAVGLNSQSVDTHKWYAISLGIATEFLGTKEKIEGGYELKKHIDRAIELDPHQAVLHYMRGRWCWGVYQLSWIERKLAATLFASPPCASVEEALECFVRAEELDPAFYKGNQVYLAKCFYEKKEYTEAKKWAESAMQMPVLTKDDREMHSEAENLLKKLL